MGSLFNTARDQILGAFPPPPGVVPNFVNPESRAHQVIIANSIMMPLATLAVVVRLYTRAIIVRSVGSDDYAILLAWILLMGHLVTIVLLLNLGMGVNIWNVPLTTFSPHILKLTIISAALYGISFLCVKVSILLLYLRLSPYFQFRLAVWIVMIVTIAYSIVGSFSFLYNCQPIAKEWDLTITEGHCIKVDKVLITHSCLNIATDFAMLLLPIALVRKLKLPTKQKVALALVFMAGTFVSVISVIRLKYIIDILRTSDLTGVGATAMIWSTMEVCIGMFCACFVCFKPFFRRHFPKLLGSTDRSDDASSNSFGRAAKAARDISTSGHEPESTQSRKSSVPQKSWTQSSTINNSQEDILGNRFSKEKGMVNAEAIMEDDRPSQNGNFWSHSPDALPSPRQGF